MAVATHHITDYSRRLYIDNVDAFVEYGICISNDNLKGFIEMPPFRKINSTEWAEYDGEEFDLTNPKLDSKTFSVEFCVTEMKYVEDFFYDLTQKAYHVLRIPDLSRSYKLRVVQNDSLSSFYRTGKIKVTLADDTPAVNQNAKLPTSTDVTQHGYKLEGVELARYGIWVLKGSDDSLLQVPNVRNTLTTIHTGQHGSIYDSAEVRFRPKDVALKCLIRASSVGEFWARWEYLFKTLVSPNEKTFFFSRTNRDYSCFYKNVSIGKFSILRSGKVWCEFTLTLCFTGVGLRPATSYNLLATETQTEDNLIGLEDGTTHVEVRTNFHESTLLDYTN